VDDASSLNICAKRRSPLALTSCSLFFTLLFSACTSSEPKYNPPAPAAAFSEIVKGVVETRGLAPKQEISLAPSGAASAGKTPEVAPNELYGGAPLAEIERAYKSIGLLPDSIDLRKELAKFRALGQLIVYDPAKSSVSWSANTSRVAGALVKLGADNARNLAPVVAVVQALQEQHFRWRAAIDSVSLEDRRSAFRAIAAGDALLTLVTRDIKKEDPKLWPATLEICAQVAAEIDKLANGLPIFLRRQLTFPYRAGGEFVSWAFRSRGWQGVNGLYANPPLSTAEILHPEKYFIQHDSALRFFPPHLLRRFKNGAVVEQSLGEDAIIGLLASERSVKSAGDIAAAWRGDQLFAFSDEAGLTTVWFSSWGTESQAQEFLRAYRAVLAKQQNVRFESPASEKNAPMIARARDQRGWLLQSKDSVVLLVNTPSSRLLDIAAEAWKDLEIEKEAMEVRFESAQAAAQFSVKSR
jgi:hypothetical protein